MSGPAAALSPFIPCGSEFGFDASLDEMTDLVSSAAPLIEAGDSEAMQELLDEKGISSNLRPDAVSSISLAAAFSRLFSADPRETYESAVAVKRAVTPRSPLQQEAVAKSHAAMAECESAEWTSRMKGVETLWELASRLEAHDLEDAVHCLERRLNDPVSHVRHSAARALLFDGMARLPTPLRVSIAGHLLASLLSDPEADENLTTSLALITLHEAKSFGQSDLLTLAESMRRALDGERYASPDVAIYLLTKLIPLVSPNRRVPMLQCMEPYLFVPVGSGDQYYLACARALEGIVTNIGLVPQEERDRLGRIVLALFQHPDFERGLTDLAVAVSMMAPSLSDEMAAEAARTLSELFDRKQAAIRTAALKALQKVFPRLSDRSRRSAILRRVAVMTNDRDKAVSRSAADFILSSDYWIQQERRQSK